MAAREQERHGLAVTPRRIVQGPPAQPRHHQVGEHQVHAGALAQRFERLARHAAISKLSIQGTTCAAPTAAAVAPHHSRSACGLTDTANPSDDTMIRSGAGPRFSTHSAAGSTTWGQRNAEAVSPMSLFGVSVCSLLRVSHCSRLSYDGTSPRRGRLSCSPAPPFNLTSEGLGGPRLHLPHALRPIWP